MKQSSEINKSARTVTSEWYERSATVAVGHYKMAERYARRHTWISALSAILSAIAGTAVFATLQQQPELWIKIAVGLLSVGAAVLATLSAAMGYQDKAEKHRGAGSKYNSVGRELEQILSQSIIEIQSLTPVRARLDALAQETPHIPRAVHNELTNFPDIGQWGTPSLITRALVWFGLTK